MGVGVDVGGGGNSIGVMERNREESDTQLTRSNVQKGSEKHMDRLTHLN